MKLTKIQLESIYDALPLPLHFSQELLRGVIEPFIPEHAARLRPIAEMPGQVPEGCIRWFCRIIGGVPVHLGAQHWEKDTHFIDIRLPEQADEMRAEFEAWAKEQDMFKTWYAFARLPDGKYNGVALENCWKCWEAAKSRP